jgi:hypothetical protein
VRSRAPARWVARAASAALGDRRSRRLAVAVAALYLLVYLIALGDLVIWTGTGASRFVRVPSVEVAADWPAQLLAQRAPFAYEPVLAIHPVDHVTVFVAPADLGMGLLLGALAGLNVGVALLATRTRRACGMRGAAGWRGAAGLLGALPALAGGVTCCVPTLALALAVGAQLAGALLAVGGYLFPVALLAAALPLVWNAHRLARAAPAAAPGSALG